ncbi:MAG TPA: futalosine hydrolase [Acidothermaceae bacterium]
MSLLVVTAVEAERDAVLRGVGSTTTTHIEVLAAGVGPVSAALGTAAALTRFPDRALVISAGIAGGFAGRVAVGDIALADRVTFADLGARVDAGFLTLNEMGLRQDSSYPVADSRVRERLAASSLRVVRGEVLTLACMTGTDDDAARLAARHPHAIAEAMEGFGVAAAAKDAGVPFAEIRAVSNVIGRRDPSTWNIRGAFDALAGVFAALTKEPW